ncbi:MAG: TetR/AcrR family transcriptional regulator [Myxococcota bacterium]
MYRGLVVDAAERLFARYGYEATKIQDIAAESGLSLGTLYSVFDGKAGVIEAIHQDRLGQLFALVEASLAVDGGAFDRLMRSNRVFVRWLGEHPDFLRIHIQGSGAWASDPANAADGQARAWRRGVDMLAMAIRAAIDEGSVHEGDPVTLARMVVAVQQVLFSTWLESDLKEDADSVADRIEVHLGRLLRRSEQ